jgi:phosphate uptake regulator
VSDSGSRTLQASFAELQQLVRHLGEELAAFRSRALSAEARVRTLVERVGEEGVHATERVAELERENDRLRERLAAAGEQARQMLERLRFLRQQQDGSEG